MTSQRHLRCTPVMRAVAIVACLGLGATWARAAEIEFDLPASVECRDVTPPDFVARDYLKVIEGKWRISARVTSGKETDVVDFLYTIVSSDKRLRFQDYLPNTTLESAVADDRVEIKDASEKAKSTGADVHVAYKILSLGLTHNQSDKQSEASCYTQIAAKELVVSSGTIDREHGVFFRLRPSRTASLEGAKEFAFLATVPKSWRGDVCKISCTARSTKSTLFSTSVAPAGGAAAEVGLFLAGDIEAAALAEELRRAQDAVAKLTAAQPPKESVFDTISHQTVGWFVARKPVSDPLAELEAAKQALSEVRQNLDLLAR